MRLILIRHGQTPSNVRGLLDTAIPGPGLTELGQRQAEALPDALVDEPIEAIFASTQRRSQLTAAPLAAALGLRALVRDGIREIDAGDLEGRNDRDSVELYLSTCMAWADDRLELSMPGGETGRETFERFGGVLSEISDLGLDCVALFSHGAILRAWSGWACRNVDSDFVAARPLSNTGVVTLNGSAAGGWLVDSWTGDAISGPQLTDAAADGPAADVPHT